MKLLQDFWKERGRPKGRPYESYESEDRRDWLDVTLRAGLA